MKKRFLILSGLLLGIGFYAVGLLASALTEGLYCERAESAGSVMSDVNRRQAVLKRIAVIQQHITELKQTGQDTTELEAIMARIRQEPLARASQIPSLPRTSMPFQKNIDGADYTCAYFKANEKASGPGWELKRPQNSDAAELELDPGLFYGLEVDQFVVDPKTNKKIPATKGLGRVKYNFKPVAR